MKQTDSKSGLTWAQALTKEKALEKRRENRLAKGLENRTLMPTQDHFAQLSVIVGRMENLPAKSKSELGLTDDQRMKILAMMDGARKGIADEIVKPKPQRKQQSI